MTMDEENNKFTINPITDEQYAKMLIADEERYPKDPPPVCDGGALELALEFLKAVENGEITITIG
ncbi:hypothetical protein FACS189499_03750 [Clostridia bacterium]|nr:hypothetical protein FACS189499_03750 [Clostridia bacterium]